MPSVVQSLTVPLMEGTAFTHMALQDAQLPAVWVSALWLPVLLVTVLQKKQTADSK